VRTGVPPNNAGRPADPELTAGADQVGTLSTDETAAVIPRDFINERRVKL